MPGYFGQQPGKNNLKFFILSIMRYFFCFVFIFCNGSVFSQDSSVVISLWKNGAPGFEDRKNEKEQAKDWCVKDIHDPSLTVFLPPKQIATGAAVIICPGGGHRQL